MSGTHDTLAIMFFLKVLLTDYMSTLTYWSVYFFIFWTFFVRRESIIFSVVIIIPRIWTVWVTAYVCTKEIYRPQRDSNPVRGSETTTLPMSYAGATYMWTLDNESETLCLNHNVHRDPYCIPDYSEQLMDWSVVRRTHLVKVSCKSAHYFQRNTYSLWWENDEVNQMTLPSRHRIRNLVRAHYLTFFSAQVQKDNITVKYNY